MNNTSNLSTPAAVTPATTNTKTNNDSAEELKVPPLSGWLTDLHRHHHKDGDTPNKQVRTIGVLTSGGDAPGMNACIRAVVRAGRYYGYRMVGVNRGYHGLLRGEINELTAGKVSGILSRGGTFLMTARSKTFPTEEGIKSAARMAKVFGIDVLVVIGGDGSFKGAQKLAHVGLPVIGIPGTIDNDVASTEYTIGYDTAMNTAMECIDKIRDTASSHERCSVIEVMGREAGYLALNVGMSSGAEVILLPEIETDFDRDVIKVILECRNMGKNHYVVVVAEGVGNSVQIAKRIEEITGIESRATILGHLQRGGSPSIRDRQTACFMGMKAVECVNEGRLNRIIAERGGKCVDLDIDEALNMKKSIARDEILGAKIIAF